MEVGKLKAWEMLKNLQEGKKLTHKTYEKGHWIALDCDMHGDLGIIGSSGAGFSLLDFLNIEEDAGWEVYKKESV